MGGCHVDLTWKGCAKVFLLSANIYLKLIFLAKLVKSFNTDLLELIRNRRGCYKFWLQRNGANKLLYCWSFPLLLRHESWSKSCERRSCGLVDFVMHQSIPPAPNPPPPGLLRAICLPCHSRRWGICKFCTARGPGICQPRGNSRAFDAHAVSYQNIITHSDSLLAESPRSLLDKSGKRKLLFPTYLGRSKETLLAGYY